ncbi:hypothetical protein HT665_04170 [Ursidibacter maritimus]|uniref:Uncharacterized protein n=1 Tax=Ursidibacter maritimus TaxID=1331689 RepID=A0A949WHW1_9PAST|nr:hypothetical protein [Ursidibacter maritimus]KAE9541352.1 hypothetical protein A1D26_00100 [Ursidibacter maritimus]MBV6524449.1 hypothetical protein [Ursidibacter maritimus]MBV6526503.1 hypothetical protein [Ursidibacter maritimus]MBV6527093.1 hypothetical protein [Ursidibacter maritimus]MBV6530390.1 hypothetical protein [Ursidibacter maritimus]
MNPKITNVLLTQIPDMYVLLDSENFLCSSTGKFAQERLDFFASTIYPYWDETRCSLHGLAEYLTQFDIELWTANDVQLSKNMEFAFDIRFNSKYPGRILVQCELFRKESVH